MVKKTGKNTHPNFNPDRQDQAGFWAAITDTEATPLMPPASKNKSGRKGREFGKGKGKEKAKEHNDDRDEDTENELYYDLEDEESWIQEEVERRKQRTGRILADEEVTGLDDTDLEEEDESQMPAGSRSKLAKKDISEGETELDGADQPGPKKRGRKPAASRPRKKRVVAKSEDIRDSKDIKKEHCKNLSEYDKQQQQKIKRIERAMVAMRTELEKCDDDEIQTIITRKGTPAFHSVFARPETRKAYTASLVAGAMKATQPDMSLSNGTVFSRDTSRFAREMMQKDWGAELEDPAKPRLRSTPRGGFPNGLEKKPAISNAGGIPEEEEEEEENAYQFTREELEMEHFEEKICEEKGVKSVSYLDLEAAYDFCADINILEHANRINSLITGLARGTELIQMPTASEESLSIDTLVEKVRKNSRNDQLSKVADAWDLIALALAVDREYTSYAAGIWKTQGHAKPLCYKDWNSGWIAQMKANDQKKGEKSVTSWTETLNHGRRWAEWCRFLSGGSDTAHRGALLALVVLRTERNTSAWSIARKDLKKDQFEYVKIYIDNYLPEFKEFSTLLNDPTSKLVHQKYLAAPEIQLLHGSLQHFTSNAPGSRLPALTEAALNAKKDKLVAYPAQSKEAENSLGAAVQDVQPLTGGKDESEEVEPPKTPQPFTPENTNEELYE